MRTRRRRQTRSSVAPAAHPVHHPMLPHSNQQHQQRQAAAPTAGRHRTKPGRGAIGTGTRTGASAPATSSGASA
jgi:hypothetical protein